MLAQAAQYTGRTGRNLFDDLVAGEIAAGTRIVTRNEHWTAFVPAAARWPYEVLLFPAQRVPDIPALSDTARDAFCDIYLDVLRRMDALFDMPLPYIAAWHQAPVREVARRRRVRPAPPGTVGAPGTWQAEVPRGNGVRHGSVDR